MNKGSLLPAAAIAFLIMGMLYFSSWATLNVLSAASLLVTYV